MAQVIDNDEKLVIYERSGLDSDAVVDTVVEIVTKVDLADINPAPN